MAVASGCSRERDLGMPFAEGLRELTLKDVHLFIHHLSKFTVYYFVPSSVTDFWVIRVNKVNKVDKFFTFKELSWKCVNMCGR